MNSLENGQYYATYTVKCPFNLRSTEKVYVYCKIDNGIIGKGVFNGCDNGYCNSTACLECKKHTLDLFTKEIQGT